MKSRAVCCLLQKLLTDTNVVVCCRLGHLGLCGGDHDAHFLQNHFCVAGACLLLVQIVVVFVVCRGLGCLGHDIAHYCPCILGSLHGNVHVCCIHCCKLGIQYSNPPAKKKLKSLYLLSLSCSLYTYAVVFGRASLELSNYLLPVQVGLNHRYVWFATVCEWPYGFLHIKTTRLFEKSRGCHLVFVPVLPPCVRPGPHTSLWFHCLSWCDQWYPNPW